MSSGKAKRRVRNRTQRYTSNVFAMFNNAQVQEFKEAFSHIDSNKDGIIEKGELEECLLSLGKEPDDAELSAMLGEAKGPINFVMFLTLFGEKMSGCDPEETIMNAFTCFDSENKGQINEDYFRELLTTMGDRWSQEDVDRLFQYAPIKDGQFNYPEFTKMMTRGQEEEDENAPPMKA